MADIELNSLKVKSDALPDSWLMMLINPTSGQMAENMTVAKFTELLNPKLWAGTTAGTESGWCKLPNGLIIQQGCTLAGVNGPQFVEITFPIAFTGGNYTILGHPVTHIEDYTRDDFLKKSANYKLGMNALYISRSSTRVYIECEPGFLASIRWIAIGY